ncbi:CbtA family protein [Phenylobacterium sp. LjRoot219]|uniref:CbtA family protein n=1 Tax=Phenylobacterium sp. LjRoot219 TaxID=3342283 RepID=UPI003ED15B17
MTRDLLVRGMLAGLLAAILAVLFARAFGEPQVDLAISFEEAGAHAHAMSMGAGQEAELVSRTVQKSFGLLTALALYGAAVGGIFAIVFALTYGRLAKIGPRAFALLLALAAFVAVSLTPVLKYPPTPPGVGLHETVAFRTGAYFLMIALSLAGLAMATQLGGWIGRRRGAFNGLLAGGGAYLLFAAGLMRLMPAINEVPAGFPAIVLWNFRLAALGTQAVLWIVLGVAFGALAERVLRAAGTPRPIALQ